MTDGLALRPYQIEIVEATLAALEQGQRGLVVAPTGTGKTVGAVEVNRRRQGRSLSIVHREELIRQTAEKMTLAGLDGLGVVKAERDDTDAQHVVASVQTLAHERRRQRLGRDFNTVWVDEAHHVAAPTYLTIMDEIGCFEESGPGTFGTTATPDRLDKLGLDRIFDKIVYEVGLVPMIRQAYLSDVRALRVVLPVDLDAVHTRGGDFVESELAEAMEAVDAPRLIAHAYGEHARERKAALFVPSVRLAHLTAEALRALGIASEALDGSTPADERRAILARLHSGATRVVPNCQVLTEGWDEPSVDAIVIARATQSRALYTQMLGRGLRLYPDKTDCLILDLVGASDKHELVTTPSLLGLDPRLVAEQGVLAADTARTEAARQRQDGLLRGPVGGAEEIDILSRRDFVWTPVGSAHVLSAGDDGWIGVEQVARGKWRVIRQTAYKGPLAVVFETTDQGYALGKAEDLARASVSRVLHDRGARWRREPMSATQIAFFERWGLFMDRNWTKGQAADHQTAIITRWSWLKGTAHMSGVQPHQRYKRDHPCPVCGGWDTQPRHQGVVCWGYVLEDGNAAICMQVATVREAAEGYVHFLDDECGCGIPHATPAHHQRDCANGTSGGHKWIEQGRWCLRDYVTGKTVAEHVRFLKPDREKTYRWRRNGSWGLHGLREKSLPLYGGYDWLQLPPDDRKVVVLTEGEKAADAARALGLPAVGIALGAPTDEAGELLLDGVGELLTAAGMPLETIRWPEAPPKGDAWDFRAAGGTHEQVLELLARAETWQPVDAEPDDDQGARIISVGRVQVDTETGEVIEDADDWPAPMADAAFYGTLGAFVKMVAVETEADPAAVLIMTMSAISAVLDPHTFIKAGDAHHPIRINAVLVGPTASGRKGTAGKIAEAVVRQADDGFIGRIVEGLSSGEGLLWAIRDEITKRDPRSGAEIVTDAGVADKRLWVQETEFATTLRVLQRDGNSLSPIIRRAWDIAADGVLRSLTKNSPARATGAHIAVAGHVTRHELLQTIERTDLVNGFANRFLWAAAKRAHVLPFGEEVNRDLVNQFAEVVRDAHDWTREGHRMRWAPDARELWAAAYPTLGSDKDDLFSAVTARAAPQILRMTELYAALEGDDMMRGAHLIAAMAVWGYCERTCRWIWGDSLGDPLADEILAALRRSGPMTRNDIYELFKRHERRARIEQALGRLLMTGLATCTKESTGGRAAEIWTAT
jgi:superfamily II DNA or RNA helicase